MTATLSSLILSFVTTSAAATSVYRCISPAGDLEFRQTPCVDGAEEQKVQVEDRRTGWEPARTKAGWKPEDPPGAKPRKHKPEKGNRPALTRQEEKCWNRRRLLEEINQKLRQGYKPTTGVKLAAPTAGPRGLHSSVL